MVILVSIQEINFHLLECRFVIFNDIQMFKKRTLLILKNDAVKVIHQIEPGRIERAIIARHNAHQIIGAFRKIRMRIDNVAQQPDEFFYTINKDAFRFGFPPNDRIDSAKINFSGLQS